MANGHGKRPPVWVPITLLLIVVAAVGYWWWTTERDAGGGALRLSGTVESREYQVASAMGGRIIEVPVAEGDDVAVDAVIAKLDDAALRLQLEQAKQGVRAAQAQVKQAKDDGTKAEVTAAKAKQAQAEAAVKIVEVQLGYTTIKAPHAGTVVAISSNAGENAGPGKTLATIADPTDLFVRVFVPEPDLASVKMGQAVKVKTDAGEYDGTVTFIASSAEFTPNTVETKEQRGNLVYETRVSVTDASGALKAGLPVDLVFEASER